MAAAAAVAAEEELASEVVGIPLPMVPALLLLGTEVETVAAVEEAGAV